MKTNKRTYRVLLFIVFNAILLSRLDAETLPSQPERNQLKNPNNNYHANKSWRVLFSASSGQAVVDFHPVLPVNYISPSSGETIRSGIGRVAQNTSAGQQPLEIHGKGQNDIYQLFLLNDNWSIIGGYSRLLYNMNPLPTSGPQAREFSGQSWHRVYYGTLEYKFTNWSRNIAPVVGYNHVARRGKYRWNNLVSTTNVFNDYLAFSEVNGHDGSQLNAARFGIWFRLPTRLKSFIQPFVEYTATRFFSAVSPVSGQVISQDLQQPGDPQGLLNAWLNQGNNSAWLSYSLRKKQRDDRKVGVKMNLRLKRFLIFSLLVRRNLDRGSWNVGSTLTMMVHKNFGMAVTYAYVEPEVNDILVRSLVVGPVITASF